jgi:hypothetical protein
VFTSATLEGEYLGKQPLGRRRRRRKKERKKERKKGEDDIKMFRNKQMLKLCVGMN